MFDHALYKLKRSEHAAKQAGEAEYESNCLSFIGCLKGAGITILALAFCLLSLSGCGRESFMVVETRSQQQAPGNYIIPPKVDILLAQDDTGSAIQWFNQINSQVVEFVRGIDGQNWDYHFAAIPLTTDRPLNLVAASKHDSNWGSDWVPSYPGELPWGPGTITSSYFRRLSDYNGLIGPGEIHSTGGEEPGFETIRRALYNRVIPSNFMRDDALTIVVVHSNGDDTSQVNSCWDATRNGYIQCEYAQGGYGPCGSLGQSGCESAALSFDYYRNQFAGTKPNPASIKFYSVVAGKRIGGMGCQGGNSYAGLRYMAMASASGGASFGACNGSVSDALAGISSNLRAQRLALRTRYLFIEAPPAVDTIRVIRYRGGNPNAAEEIPQDPVNGWTYEGLRSNLYAIDSPIEMNLSSGYTIELHGTAKLQGDDTADVTFKPAGAGNSRS